MTDISDNLARGWIETSSGRQFYFQNTTPDMINIKDISASLSKLCRYNGHTSSMYSVGHHSVLMASWLAENGHSPRVSLQALLHDATEAYIGDMVRPLKGMFPEFKDMEEKLWEIIANKFDVPVEMYDIVKELDTRILVDERFEFMPRSEHDWGLDGIKPLGVIFHSWWKPADVYRFFLEDFAYYNMIVAQEELIENACRG